MATRGSRSVSVIADRLRVCPLMLLVVFGLGGVWCPSGNAADESGDSATSAAAPPIQSDPLLKQRAIAATPGESSSSEQHASAPRPLEQVEQVVVTGTRLEANVSELPTELLIITREQIDESGATRVVDVLNRLPEVSFSVSQTSFQATDGVASVALRGLPLGSTLVLINGRRVQGVTGAQIQTTAIFNLNYIPLSAVERIEVSPTGSSAIYGGDALAGVVNIILRKEFSGVDGGVRYSHVSGADRTDASMAYGWQTDRASVTAIASFSDQSVLNAGERTLTASDDKRPFGGPDLRTTSSNPANVYSLNGQNLPGLNSTFAGVPPGSSGVGLTTADFAATAGVPNLQSRVNLLDIIPETKQYGLYLAASYQLTPSVEVFSELLATKIDKATGNPAPVLRGGSAGTYFVPASSPFNPFGVPVGVDYFFEGFGRLEATDWIDYVRPLVGARGALPAEWSWELSALSSTDHDEQFVPGIFADRSAILAALAATDPAQALNVFQDGPGASKDLLASLYSSLNQKFRGQLNSATGFVRGPIAKTGAGSIDVVLGGEASMEEAFSGSPVNPLDADRHSYAAFAEARVPVLAALGTDEKALLTLNGAVRYDHFDDFGDKTSPQVGIELRPSDAVLVRASYSSAFKPPSLLSLYRPTTTLTATVADPLRSNAPTIVTIVGGGNPDLRATTSDSSSAGLVYSPNQIPGLDISLTWWAIHLKDGVGTPGTQTLISNEAQFPGRVQRAPPSATDIAAGQPGPITEIDATALNFGTLDVSGFDFDIGWTTRTDFGEFSPRVSATYTRKYSGPDAPGGPSVDRVARADSTGFAPRWKGITSLAWEFNPLHANVDARYLGSYLDYGTASRRIGDCWFFDVSVNYPIGELLSTSAGEPLRSLDLRFGGVNLLDNGPPYSNYQSGFLGYDPAQYDIAGRLLYVQLGTKF